MKLRACFRQRERSHRIWILECDIVTTPSTDEILAQWLHGRPKLTQKAYLRDVTNAMTFLDYPILENISLAHLQRYQSHLAEVRHLKPSTVNRQMTALRSLFKFCVRQGYITRNHAEALQVPKVNSDLNKRILTPEQVQTLIAHARNDKERLLLRFTYAIGCRVSEVCGLTWADCVSRVDGKASVTLLGKRGKQRTVVLPSQVWADLAKLRSGPADSVFGMNRYQAHDAIKAAAAAAGLSPDISFHWLRHATASHSLAAGAKIHVVRDTLGHSSIAVTDIYLHANPDESAGDFLSL